MSEKTVAGSSDADVQDMATLVAGMSRFLTGLSNLPPFQEAGMGLSEWSALSIIAGKTGLNNRQLANALGVSAQRVNQITEALQNAGHVLLNTPADDKRKKTITITASGKARLDALNAKLQPLISAAVSRSKTVGRASRIVNRTLMPIVTSPKAAERKVPRTKEAVLQRRAARE